MNQPSEEEVERLLAAPKRLNSPQMTWKKKPSSHNPMWWTWFSSVEIAGTTPAELFVRLNWQAPLPGAERPKFCCSLLWHSHRIFGVDMEETRHRNPAGMNRPYAGQRIYNVPVHQHIWDNVYRSEYVEPVEIYPSERDVFAYFASRANIQLTTSFVWPESERQPPLF